MSSPESSTPTSVTEVAIKMHEFGAINYSRGIIKIVDLQKLKELSCECYETLRDETPESPSTRSRL